jgi:hypothetical protein
VSGPDEELPGFRGSTLGSGDTTGHQGSVDTISISVSARFRGHHLIQPVLLGTQPLAFGSSLGARLGSGLLASKNSAEVLFECRQVAVVMAVLISQAPRRKGLPYRYLHTAIVSRSLCAD